MSYLEGCKTRIRLVQILSVTRFGILGSLPCVTKHGDHFNHPVRLPVGFSCGSLMPHAERLEKLLEAFGSYYTTLSLVTITFCTPYRATNLSNYLSRGLLFLAPWLLPFIAVPIPPLPSSSRISRSLLIAFRQWSYKIRR